jgi:hypothetical protein
MHMAKPIIHGRVLVAMTVALGVGAWGLRMHPMPLSNVFLALISLRAPTAMRVLSYGYAGLWFTTPFFFMSLITSGIAIATTGRAAPARRRPLPTYPAPEDRPTPSLVLGESHFTTAPGRAPEPNWLVIPQRGLYTGVMILGATGSGKTSACMYPYVDQLVRWRAHDQERKIGGVVLEVKGDFCHEVRQMLTRAGRADDYLEIGIDTGTCYNPLHNDLDPYAVAYAVGMLLNNLFGKSREPFWQQAYVDVLRFVILLRRIVDGYTTLSEVYRYILEDALIDRDIRRLKEALAEAPEVLLVSTHDHRLACTNLPWTHWFQDDVDHMAHPYDSDLETCLASRNIPYRVQRAQGTGWTARKHQLDAVERWYRYGWTRLDTRLRSSITEGILVFLALFDENPAVHRSFCPPRSAYIGERRPGDPIPLPPLEDVLESGRVLALNFPVATNPGLARALCIMLKLDHHRVILHRISRIAANPDRIWRDLMFVCDEYPNYATVGESDPTGDERTLSLSRQARLIPIVAGPSYSSLRSALPSEEACDALTQCFGTKIFLATRDERTARKAAELCGRRDQLKVHYSFAEAGQNAHVSWLTGRSTAPKQTLTASKSYSPQNDYIFPPRAFTQLKNAQAIVLPYDGVNPLPPQYVYLKPHYLDVNTSYFDHVERGVL